MTAPAIGIIGGSGLYQMEGLTDVREHAVETPFGPPSDALIGGLFAGRQIYFLPRHGRGHRILPHELNHRANIYALRSLGVRWLLCVTAVGSLQEQYAPRHIVLPSQFFDRTSQGAAHTFFGHGIAAHVSFAEPTCAPLRQLLANAARDLDLPVHNGGTYVNMDGPAFSTRAESETHRRLGFDVIGMTNLGEVRLAREAEMAVATMAMITDYDCWKTEEEPVTADAVIAHLHANAAAAKRILAHAIPHIPTAPEYPEHRALDSALVTDRALWPAATVQKLGVILERFPPREEPFVPARVTLQMPPMVRSTLAFFVCLSAAVSAAPPTSTPRATPPVATTPAPAATPVPGPKITYSQCNVDGPYIAFTFDDGPHGVQTPRVLDMLKQRGLKATFFVCGQCVAEFPQIAKRIAAEGHELASHSWSHPNLIPMSEDAVRDQLERTHAIVKQSAGVEMKVFRPPYGNFTARQRAWAFATYGYKTILWDVDTLDWQHRNPAKTQSIALARTVPGSIILTHDIHKSTIDAMPETLDGLLGKGFKFVTVSELLAMDRPVVPKPRATPAAATPAAGVPPGATTATPAPKAAPKARP